MIRARPGGMTCLQQERLLRLAHPVLVRQDSVVSTFQFDASLRIGGMPAPQMVWKQSEIQQRSPRSRLARVLRCSKWKRLIPVRLRETMVRPEVQSRATTIQPNPQGDKSSLSDFSNRIRRGALLAIHAAGSGHPGGSLSCVDLLSYLWSRELSFEPGDPRAPKRDRFILSKGHACPALYSTFCELGLISEANLLTLRQLDSPLQGHPHVTSLPWVETSTGSLGQGFSVAVGMALGLRHQGTTSRVHVMLGDGELQEGEVWEAVMCAGHHRLDNLCVVVDYNKMQSDALNENIMGLEPLASKWRAFNWFVVEINGHDFSQIEEAYRTARGRSGIPTAIVAHTIKGKGVSFMEGSPLWHGSVQLRDEELARGLRELETPEEEITRYLHGTN